MVDRGREHLTLALAALAVLALALPSSAGANLYWANGDTNTIARASLDGSGVIPGLIVGADQPWGVAVDAQHVYWTNQGAGTIGRARLDGSDVRQDFISNASSPRGIAVSSSHIYWANGTTSSIGRADLNGGNADPEFIANAAFPPTGVAVNATHVYWGNGGSQTVRRANLNGSGVETVVASTGAAPIGPFGVTVDAAHLYWAGFHSSPPHAIGRSALDGGNPALSFIPLPQGGPSGVAVDSARVYWTNNSDGTIGRANRDGSGAEHGFITGALGPAGIAVAAPSNQFSFGKLTRNRKRGTARLAIRVPGSGVVRLAQSKLLRANRAAHAGEGRGTVALRVRARGKALRKLKRARRGGRAVRVAVSGRVTYRPSGGEPRTKAKRLRLVRKR